MTLLTKLNSWRQQSTAIIVSVSASQCVLRHCVITTSLWKSFYLACSIPCVQCAFHRIVIWRRFQSNWMSKLIVEKRLHAALMKCYRLVSLSPIQNARHKCQFEQKGLSTELMRPIWETLFWVCCQVNQSIYVHLYACILRMCLCIYICIHILYCTIISKYRAQ